MSSGTIDLSEKVRQAELTRQAAGREVNLPRDAAALTLVAITLLLTVSLVTRDPADPLESPVWPLSLLYQPDYPVYPLNPSITNACGYWGALTSAMLFDAVGLASALVIAAVGGVATALLVRGRVDTPIRRSLGGCVVLVATATALNLVPGHWPGMPVVGAGGHLGAMTSTWLLERFAPVGAWILAATVLAIGLLMTTDYVLLKAVQKFLVGGGRVSRTGWKCAAGAVPLTLRRRRQPFTDLEQPILVDDESPHATAGESTRGSRNTRPDDRDDGDPQDGPKIRFRNPPKRRGDEPPPGRPSRTGTAAEGSESGPAKTAPDAHAPADAPPGRDGRPDDSADNAPIASDPDDVESGTDDDDGTEPDGEIRMLETDEETLALRGDQGHPLPAPKVRMPQRKADQRQELLDAVDESMPLAAEAYMLPSLQLLERSDDVSYEEQLDEVRRKARILEATFQSFGFNIRVVEIETGPVIAQYEVELEAGLRLSKITGLADDLAIALRVPSVRIVAPIPGKNTVGIEVPNENRQVVRLRDVIEESDVRSSKMNIPIFLGKDVSGNPMVVDLAKMPHLLIAGRTGTGKSVCLNAIISSVLMCCRPDEVRMLMIDPKMVELSGYGRLPHLMHPVITDMRKAEAILAWAVEKMEERYSLLAKVGVRHINSFNSLGREEVLHRLEIDESDEPTDVPERLPFIVIVADEMADLMMTAGKDVEQHIIRLAQKSRAVGIHLILATQKPTVDVITGLIKSNLPARLSFQVASKTDSRVVLDENGAEKLLGNGDMLFLWPGTSTLIRGQGTYLSDEEIDRLCGHCATGEQQFVGELMELKVSEEDGEGELDVGNLRKRDELYESAIEVVVREQRGSLSLIQRCLGIGYGRAARLVDYMAEDGIVGEYNGSKSREVLLNMDQWRRMQGLEADDAETPAATAPAPLSPESPPNPDDAGSGTGRPEARRIAPASSRPEPTGGPPDGRLDEVGNARRQGNLGEYEDLDEYEDADGEYEDVD